MFAHPGRNGDDDDDEVSHWIMIVCGGEEREKKKFVAQIYYSAFLLEDFQILILNCANYFSPNNLAIFFLSFLFLRLILHSILFVITYDHKS